MQSGVSVRTAAASRPLNAVHAVDHRFAEEQRCRDVEGPLRIWAAGGAGSGHRDGSQSEARVGCLTSHRQTGKRRGVVRSGGGGFVALAHSLNHLERVEGEELHQSLHEAAVNEEVQLQRAYMLASSGVSSCTGKQRREGGCIVSVGGRGSAGEGGARIRLRRARRSGSRRGACGKPPAEAEARDSRGDVAPSIACD